MIGPPERPASLHKIQYVGHVGPRTVWQDVKRLDEFLVASVPGEYPPGLWVRRLPDGRHAGVGVRDERRRAALTPAETCDLYAAIEAAYANPPTPETNND